MSPQEAAVAVGHSGRREHRLLDSRDVKGAQRLLITDAVPLG